MGLKQIITDKRVIFLRMFTEELLYNSLEKERVKQSIEAEKIRQKFLEPKKDHEIAFKSIIRGLPIKPQEYKKELEPSQFAKTKTTEEKKQGLEPSKLIHNQQQKRVSVFPKYRIRLKSEPVFIKGNLITEPLKQIPQTQEQTQEPQSFQKQIQPQVQDQQQKISKPQVQIIRKQIPVVKQVNEELQSSKTHLKNRYLDNINLKPVIKPPAPQAPLESVKRIKELMVKTREIPMSQTGDYGYKKIENILRDPSISSIECQGPGKPLLVKRQNKLQKTRIILNQAEIMEVIDTYSRQARIPLVGGILKAAVGNSIISAVNSEFVGARFIINKITPYSILDRS